jgi:hypothetical protein
VVASAVAVGITEGKFILGHFENVKMNALGSNFIHFADHTVAAAMVEEAVVAAATLVELGNFVRINPLNIWHTSHPPKNAYP